MYPCHTALTQPGKQLVKSFQNRLENRNLVFFLLILPCFLTKDCTIVPVTFLKTLDFCYMTAALISDFLFSQCLFLGNVIDWH